MTVTLKIDGIEVTVPKGTLIVDAAKKVGIDIPVFCYHPKLEPVGMCRMCLVEIGRPVRDRKTGQAILDESGNPTVEYRGNLETACTTPVGEGWEVKVASELAQTGRKQILEFLLTSHPLDCPICDKGGECPLQNLTMEHGPGESRFVFTDKMRLDKHLPLGELIFLDRERCIQCGRCVRFQDELAGEPVLGFTQRGRRMEITTFSTPGFDSYFSGNTTDICPVGALTTADFRFGARPWELNSIASICPHCPVGCNLTVNTRREAKTGGDAIVKRVLPRQNETVNEIWICDKGRFAHHYATSQDRLDTPLLREGEALVPVSWEQALAKLSEGFRKAEGKLAGVASGRLSNEDLYLFQKVLATLGGKAFLDTRMAGGDLVQQWGLSSRTHLGELGEGDAILIIAADLMEEAPIWWLRIKAAVKRGAKLVVANARPTRLEEYASQTVRFAFGETTLAAHALGKALAASRRSKQTDRFPGLKKAAEILKGCQNLVVFAGSEGLDLQGSRILMETCAYLLHTAGSPGHPNNGLVPVWPRNNDQGAWDMGLQPRENEWSELSRGTKAFYFVGSDPLGDNPYLEASWISDAFVVVQDLFLTETAKCADVVLPASSFLEREGTYTTAERRVQRFYQAISASVDARPDWKILAEIGGSLGLDLSFASAAEVFLEIAAQIPGYQELSYRALSQVEEQWPIVGDSDLYFGGTSYKNRLGMGVKLKNAVELGEKIDVPELKFPPHMLEGEWLLVPVAALLDHGTTVLPSTVLQPRLVARSARLHPADGAALGLKPERTIELRWNGSAHHLPVDLDPRVPQGVVLVPRSIGLGIAVPTVVELNAGD